MRKSFTLTAIFLLSLGGYAQLIRKYSNEFLALGAGARGLAMSGAVTASTDGAEAGYWNPAGLFQSDLVYEAALMHASWFASIANYDYLSLGFSPSESPYRLGISLFRFAIDDIQNTLNLVDQEGQVDYSRITRFSAADYALMAHFAMPVKRVENLHLGINSKLIYRNIGPFANAFGFGFDVGALYHFLNWHMSVVIRDVTTTFNAWFINKDQLKEAFEQTDNEMPEENIELTPPVLTLGVARRFALNADFGLLTEVNTSLLGGPQAGVNIGTVLTLNPSIGLEADYREWVYLRLGAGRFQKTTTFNGGEQWLFSPSAGLGLHFGRLKIDYALTNLASFESALISHIFSLKLKFGKR